MEKHPNLNCFIGHLARNPIFIRTSVVHYLHTLSRSLALRFVNGVLPSPVLPAFVLNDSSPPMTKSSGVYLFAPQGGYSVKTAYATGIISPPSAPYMLSPIEERGGRGGIFPEIRTVVFAPLFGFCHNPLYCRC